MVLPSSNNIGAPARQVLAFHGKFMDLYPLLSNARSGASAASSKERAPRARPARAAASVSPFACAARSLFIKVSSTDWIAAQGNYVRLYAGSESHPAARVAAERRRRDRS